MHGWVLTNPLWQDNFWVWSKQEYWGSLHHAILIWAFSENSKNIQPNNYAKAVESSVTLPMYFGQMIIRNKFNFCRIKCTYFNPGTVVVVWENWDLYWPFSGAGAASLHAVMHQSSAVDITIGCKGQLNFEISFTPIYLSNTIARTNWLSWPLPHTTSAEGLPLPSHIISCMKFVTNRRLWQGEYKSDVSSHRLPFCESNP